MTPALVALAFAAAPFALRPAPGDPAPGLASLAPYVGGSWVGEGTWEDGRPFYARHVFEWGLGGASLRVRSYGRRDGNEVPLFETLLVPGPGDVLSLHCVAAFGKVYTGSGRIADRGSTLELEAADPLSGDAYEQRFELDGADGYAWTDRAPGEGEPQLLARIAFQRTPFVPLDEGERAVRAEVVVDAPCAAVWDAWTTTEGLESFFATRANVELRVDGAYEILFDPDAPAGQRGAEGTRVLALDPGRMLAFTWDSTPRHAVRGQHTNVVVRFEPLGAERSRVTLVNSGFGQGSDWPESLAYFEHAWPYVLDNLKKHFARGDDAEAPGAH